MDLLANGHIILTNAIYNLESKGFDDFHLHDDDLEEEDDVLAQEGTMDHLKIITKFHKELTASLANLIHVLPIAHHELIKSIRDGYFALSMALEAPERKINTLLGHNSIPSSMADERFLHNHAECINAHMKVVDLDYFLKTVELDNDTRALEPSPTKLESMAHEFKTEEMPEVLFGDEVSRFKKSEFLDYGSPTCQSPKSPVPPYFNWKDDDFCDMIVSKSP